MTRDELLVYCLAPPDAAHVMANIGRSGWNTLDLDKTIEDDELFEAVDDSYATVLSKLPKKQRPPG
ncbi:MAG: hypothetical protein WKF72_07100 [Nocardioidaceae bacterium]|jgi:hypothetical protein